MKRVLVIMAAGFIAISTASCASYPERSVTQGSEGGAAIALLGSPAGAEVLVNGVSYGAATRYNGRDAVLAVEPGRHILTIVDRGQIIMEREIYVGSDAILEIHVR